MPAALILTKFTNLEINGSPNMAEWELMPGLTLSTDMDQLKIFLTEPFELVMGAANAHNLLSSQNYIYAILDDEEIQRWIPEFWQRPDMLIVLMDVVLLLIRNFLRATWLIKCTMIVIT